MVRHADDGEGSGRPLCGFTAWTPASRSETACSTLFSSSSPF